MGCLASYLRELEGRDLAVAVIDDTIEHELCFATLSLDTGGLSSGGLGMKRKPA